MRFSFEESELLNQIINSKTDKIALTNMLSNLKNSADIELSYLCNSLIEKIELLSNSQFNTLIKQLPVDHISIY